VSAAFHSPLVAAAQGPFAQVVAGIALAPGNMPVFANTTGEIYPTAGSEAAALLAAQLAHSRQIWLKRLVALPRAYSESPCCRAPMLPLLSAGSDASSWDPVGSARPASSIVQSGERHHLEEEALAAALEAGAAGAVVSGSGPSLLAFVRDEEEAKRVGEAMLEEYRVYELEAALRMVSTSNAAAGVIDASPAAD